MARAPAAAAAPADDDEMEDQTDNGADEGAEGEGEDEGAEGGDTVVVTICKGADGTYTVYAGDEPEDEGEGEDEGEEGGEAEGGEPQGQSADSPGQALALAHDILMQDAEGDQGSAHDNFTQGFGEQEAVPQAEGGQ